MDKQTDGQTDIWENIQMDKLNRWTNRQTDKQTDGQIDSWAYKQMDKQKGS